MRFPAGMDLIRSRRQLNSRPGSMPSIASGFRSIRPRTVDAFGVANASDQTVFGMPSRNPSAGASNP